MPYQSTSELPSAVRSKYQSRCQRAYLHAFNSVHARTGDEGRAAAAGHTAAQRCEGAKSMNTFRIYSGLLKAYEQDGRKMLRTTASSSVADLSKDEILPSAIHQMADRARNNLTIFLNHEYRVPEDVLGSVETATVVQRGVDNIGSPIFDLDFDLVVNESNPRALQTYAAIENGVQLGTSIGAIVRHATKKKDGGYRVDDIELLEASIVGIPANPRSWVHYAVKSLTTTVDNDEPEIDEEDDEPEETEVSKAAWAGGYESALPDSAFACSETRKYPHHSKSGAVDLPHLRAALSRVGDKSNDQCGKGHLLAHARKLGIGDRRTEKEFDEIVALGIIDTLIAAASATPDVETTDAEPDKTDATVVVEVEGQGRVWVDTSRKPQDAEDSTPENGLQDEDRGDAPTEPDNEQLGDTLTQGAVPEVTTADEVVAFATYSVEAGDLTSIVKALQGAIDQIELLRKKLDTAESERDNARENFEIAKAIVEKIAKLPIGPKATYRKAAEDFHQRFGGVYSDEFLQFLER
jgi:HK97 family phage prohead protease